jgi:hypothetical protein
MLDVWSAAAVFMRLWAAGLSPPECGFRVRFGVVRAGAFVVAASAFL